MKEEIATNKLVKFSTVFQTGFDPPPYRYSYELEINKTEVDYQCNFRLTYLDREELTEEEIFDEGFTLNDDYVWNGQFPEVWFQEIVSTIEKTKWKNVVNDDETDQLILTIEKGDGNIKGGTPTNKETWIYLLQEIIQALYEISNKEEPLKVDVKSLMKGETRKYTLEGKFSKRIAIISLEEQSKAKIVKEITWKNLKNLLTKIYALDFENLKVTEKEPSKPGLYVSPGDNFWYQLNQTNGNYEDGNHIIESLESFLRTR